MNRNVLDSKILEFLLVHFTRLSPVGLPPLSIAGVNKSIQSKTRVYRFMCLAFNSSLTRTVPVSRTEMQYRQP